MDRVDMEFKANNKKIHRGSGILMHISSLPSPYGIGTFGSKAFDFADFLADAGQKYWQILPLGHTGYADSPYQCFSMFGGNPYFIDLDILISKGWLNKQEVEEINWGADPQRVDYYAVFSNREKLLKRAFARAGGELSGELTAFRENNSGWLEDYALFMALKRLFGMRSWLEWEDESIRVREEKALVRYRDQLADEIDFYVFVQYLFFQQWDELRKYVSKLGIKLIGDLPIYPSMDSSEVWSRPEFFLLDANRKPKVVAGVPPDYFSEEGQLWGNPIYDWQALKKAGYSLWVERMQVSAKQFDVLRIDHFRGLESYYCVPYENKNAIEGVWRKGPGMDFIRVLHEKVPHTSIIAEDLGVSTKELIEFVEESGYPGMKVLQFAFDSKEPSDGFLPHRYINNCVCYTGTHDNSTINGWIDSIPKEDLQFAVNYFGLNSKERYSWGMIRGGMSSVSDLFVAQMQDYLELNDDCRMNIPSVVEGNWQWRMLEKDMSAKLSKRIKRMVELYGR